MWTKIKEFLFGDWSLIKVVQGEWYKPYNKNVIIGRVLYEVHYSKTLKKYKISFGGYKPKQHPLYVEVMDYINDLKMSRKETSKTERQEYNQKILKEIRSMVANNPDLRFGEVLCDLNIINLGALNNSVFEESEETYNRIISK